MPENIRPDHESSCICPICKFLAAYRDSEAAQHVRGIQREAVGLARCLVGGALRKAREHLESTPPKSK